MKKWLLIGLLGLFLAAPAVVHAGEQGDQYYVSCLLANTGLAPANQRFYCACQAANYQNSIVENANYFEKGNAKQSCLSTINPYYELLHQQKLLAQQSNVGWAWL